MGETREGDPRPRTEKVFLAAESSAPSEDADGREGARPLAPRWPQAPGEGLPGGADSGPMQPLLARGPTRGNVPHVHASGQGPSKVTLRTADRHLLRWLGYDLCPQPTRNLQGFLSILGEDMDRPNPQPWQKAMQPSPLRYPTGSDDSNGSPSQRGWDTHTPHPPPSGPWSSRLPSPGFCPELRLKGTGADGGSSVSKGERGGPCRRGWEAA